MISGGKRPGAGRKPTNIDEKRMMFLVSQGFTQREIAQRFAVPVHVIQARVLKIAKNKVIPKI